MTDTEIVVEPGRQDIVVTRVFDAPRDVVSRAYTDPNLIPSWWGPRRYAAEVERMNLTPGGRWRIVNRETDGTAFASSEGVHHDIVADERIVRTVEFSRMAGHVQLHTDTFVDFGAKTRYVSVALCQSVDDRDRWITIDAEACPRESMDRRAELLRVS